MVEETKGTVGQVMSHPPLTSPPGATVAKAAADMRDRRVGAVLVVDEGRPVGILTERDLVRFAASGRDARAATVDEWMTHELDTEEPGTEVAVAFSRMAEGRYRHLPVMEGERLVGMVSMRDLVTSGPIHTVRHPDQIEAPRGLKGVIVAETSVGDVRGQEGFYHYRQHSAVELAEKRSLEDVWHLLFRGHLPDASEGASFSEEVRSYRHLPEGMGPLLPAIAATGGRAGPLDALRSAVSVATSSLGLRASLDIGAEELGADAMRVCALVPTLATALYRVGRGLDPVDPHPELGTAANYLYMLSGSVPDPEHARAVEQYLIATIDHGFNASTFTARVVASTGADLGGAVVSAIASLSGPLHGGAPSRALDMLDAIGTPDNTDAWIRRVVADGGRIMGFGHRVYKTDDPRSLLLRGIAERLGGDKARFAAQVERTIVDVLAELKPGRQLYANVEFYAGVVMDRCGIPREMFTPTFACSRVIGWCANVLEQAGDNRIIRPSARYVGPPPPQPVPDPA